MAIVNQNNFQAGMNFLTVMTDMAGGEYPIAQNVRVRFGGVQGIKRPKDYTDKFISGNVQGIFGAGENLLVIINGLAFNMNAVTNVVTQVSGFSMSATEQDIFGELVPASTINFKRVPVTDSVANTGVNFTTGINGTPAAGIFFDGVSRPHIIFSNGSARALGDYAGWTQNSPEYVPQGKYPMYLDGILYIAMYNDDSLPAGQKVLNKIAHSVSGQPFNFMVVIDGDGDRLPQETDGGARAVSHGVGYDEITNISKISSVDGAFYVGTNNSSTLVIQDTANLIYGEPTFRNQFQFDTGAINPYSLVGILGDTAFIDQTGLRSFNAVTQLKFQGQNSPFSKQVYKLFEGITQTRTAAVNFDNYALFSITTIYGPAVLVYDTLINRYVSLDIHPDFAQICQFAVVKTANVYRLFARTVNNQIIELYGSSSNAVARVYIGDHGTQDPKVSQRVNSIHAVLMGADTTGTIEARLYVDKVESAIRTAQVTAHNYQLTPPYPIPYQAQRIDCEPVVFNFVGSQVGWKVGCMLSWNTGGQLTNVTIDTTDFVQNVAVQKAGEVMTANSVESTGRFAIIGDSTAGADLTEVIDEIRGIGVDYIISTGNNNPAGDSAGVTSNILVPFSSEFYNTTKFYAALGNLDLDVQNGAPIINTFRQPNNSRYFSLTKDNIVWHFVNAGYKSNNTNVEPDGNTETSAQAAYIAANIDSNKMNFMVVNKPPYSNTASSYPALRWPHVSFDAVFAGFAKVYERIENNTSTYVTVGSVGLTPGAFTSVVKPQAAVNNVYIIGEYSRYQVTFKVYQAGNSTPLDIFVVQLA